MQHVVAKRQAIDRPPTAPGAAAARIAAAAAVVTIAGHTTMARAGVLLVCVLAALAYTAAAARQLQGMQLVGKGGHAGVSGRFLPAVPSAGAFYQSRTFFTAAPTLPTTYVQQAPVVAAQPVFVSTAAPRYTPYVAPVVAAQPTIVAAQSSGAGGSIKDKIKSVIGGR